MYKIPWLNRKKISVFGLLIIVFISAVNSFPDIAKMLNQRINLNKASDYICLEQGIPTGEDVLFMGNPFVDPTHADSLALYYRSQYFLTPRLVVLMDYQDEFFSTSQYRWFISTTLNQEQLGDLKETYALTLVKDCGDLMLLQVQVQP